MYCLFILLKGGGTTNCLFLNYSKRTRRFLYSYISYTLQRSE